MPYIEKRNRADLAERNFPPHTAGELNFVITSVCLEYVEEKVASYEAFNAAIGALECAKLELYRRMVAPYEDAKMAENGDVYPRTEPK